ncbi:uncharacterized protein [Nicotiana tomentosiformis]|uniref:uncharacterized protein n=1 Tax=Nicotiana tomentosiformis TaxID=4098 RepID=UPI001444C3B6|nr:uncharacterized protein LOC117275426 [Nicotiana tomentosiformis]
MGERLTINMIIPKTEEWTCKIQAMDKGRPKDNKEKTKKYQLMTLQDKEENQVQAIMYNVDITHFEDLFDPFHTYLVVAPVKESSYLYGNPLNKFTWTIDRSTIVEPIEKVTPPQDPLPPPMRLTITALDTSEYQPKESEFDI